MADLTHQKNRLLTIKRYERDKLVALAQIQAREIRIMEVQDEIDRCKEDIENQKKVIANLDSQIKQQQDEIAKEQPQPQPPQGEE